MKKTKIPPKTEYRLSSREIGEAIQLYLKQKGENVNNDSLDFIYHMDGTGITVILEN